jgi:chromosome segregation ATPase
MLQSQAALGTASALEDAPLQGRVTTLMAEVASLQGRVGGLMEDVGVTGEAAALQKRVASSNFANSPLAKKALGTTALYARYKELLNTKKYEEGALKDDISTLEADCSQMRSNILLLENQVQDGASLFASYAYNPTSLSSRVEALEKDVADFRTRVTSLEQVVAGLQTKAATKEEEKPSVLEVSATKIQTKAKAKLGPMASRLTSLETEVSSLQQRANHMEATVQGAGAAGGAGALFAEDVAFPEVMPVAPHHGRHREPSLLEREGEAHKHKSIRDGTIRDRTAALESSVADLKSKLSMLENQVSGKNADDADASLLQVKGSGTSLKARIHSLEEEVDSLRTRVSTLEHVVEG